MSTDTRAGTWRHKDWWECSVCGGLLGRGLDACGGDDEYGDHEPVRRPDLPAVPVPLWTCDCGAVGYFPSAFCTDCYQPLSADNYQDGYYAEH